MINILVVLENVCMCGCLCVVCVYDDWNNWRLVNRISFRKSWFNVFLWNEEWKNTFLLLSTGFRQNNWDKLIFEIFSFAFFYSPRLKFCLIPPGFMIGLYSTRLLTQLEKNVQIAASNQISLTKNGKFWKKCPIFGKDLQNELKKIKVIKNKSTKINSCIDIHILLFINEKKFTFNEYRDFQK